MITLKNPAVTAAVLIAVSLGLSACDTGVTNKEAGSDERRTVLQDGLVDDIQVTNAVKQALQQEDQLRNLNINVDTRKGDVKLTGTVNTEQQRELAEQITQTTAGAHTVNNELQVKN